MPELPEVETIMRGISPFLAGATIKRIKLNRADLRWPFPENFASRVKESKVLNLKRRSKYILINLSTGETLLIHLGMSGKILVSDSKIGNYFYESSKLAKHDHVIFELNGGTIITYNDPRRFGAMDLAKTDDLNNHKFLEKLGPEPLGNNFNSDYLKIELSKKESPIKNVLLNQSVVAGLGNIYVCEALFMSGISPKKIACKISKNKCEELVQNIRAVLISAIEAGGSSLKDFTDIQGNSGYFQFEFYVYGRENEYCKTANCDRKIKRISQSGRSSFYCPYCQR
ncbi:MAG: bifunctional DNA-formamidopyrimidine glycosylase/DNA-(apurinic or apyrimidinic site) lyase [Paracoccaceae bacterium]